MHYKFGTVVENQDIEYSYPNHFAIEQTTGPERLCIGLMTGHSDLVLALAEALTPPFYLLYVLHTPRGQHEPARYQSPALLWDDVTAFMSRFRAFLEQDARHDLWLHSVGADATLVWERHNLIYAYGPLSAFDSLLRQRGLTVGMLSIPVPHTHHYHAAFDRDEEQLLVHFDWTTSPLQSEDEQ